MKKLWSWLFLAAVLAIAGMAQGDNPVPAHHQSPPPKGEKLPPILAKDQLWGPSFQHDYQVHAYELASKIPNVIYQMPCYCFCERIGHTSLHTCYESTHAAHCSACLKELYFSYQQHKKGKTAAQIRQAIVKGEWESVDLEKAAQIN